MLKRQFLPKHRINHQCQTADFYIRSFLSEVLKKVLKNSKHRQTGSGYPMDPKSDNQVQVNNQI